MTFLNGNFAHFAKKIVQVGTSNVFQVQESVTGHCQFIHDHIIFLPNWDSSENERGTINN